MKNFEERLKQGVKCLNREEKLRMVMIEALAKEDNYAIVELEEEYKKLKEQTDMFIEEFLKEYGISAVESLDNKYSEKENFDDTELVTKRILAMMHIKIGEKYTNTFNENSSQIVCFNSISSSEEYIYILLKIGIWYLNNHELSPTLKNLILEDLKKYSTVSNSIRESLSGNTEYAEWISNPQNILGAKASNMVKDLAESIIAVNLNNFKSSEKIIEDLSRKINELKFYINITNGTLKDEYQNALQINQYDLEKHKAIETVFSIEIAALYLQLEKYGLSLSKPQEELSFYQKERITDSINIAEEYKESQKKKKLCIK